MVGFGTTEAKRRRDDRMSVDRSYNDGEGQRDGEEGKRRDASGESLLAQNSLLSRLAFFIIFHHQILRPLAG